MKLTVISWEKEAATSVPQLWQDTNAYERSSQTVTVQLDDMEREIKENTTKEFWIAAEKVADKVEAKLIRCCTTIETTENQTAEKYLPLPTSKTDVMSKTQGKQ